MSESRTDSASDAESRRSTPYVVVKCEAEADVPELVGHQVSARYDFSVLYGGKPIGPSVVWVGRRDIELAVGEIGPDNVLSTF